MTYLVGFWILTFLTAFWELKLVQKNMESPQTICIKGIWDILIFSPLLGSQTCTKNIIIPQTIQVRAHLSLKAPTVNDL